MRNIGLTPKRYPEDWREKRALQGVVRAELFLLEVYAYPNDGGALERSMGRNGCFLKDRTGFVGQGPTRTSFANDARADKTAIFCF